MQRRIPIGGGCPARGSAEAGHTAVKDKEERRSKRMLKQISVFVENVAGSLMKVTKELVAEGINLRAISSFDTPEFGILRLIVDRPEDTVQLLKDKGFFVRVKDVIAVEIEDRSGSLNRMLEVLAEGNISINYIYSFVIREDQAPVMVFQTEYLEEAVQILKNHGIHVID